MYPCKIIFKFFYRCLNFDLYIYETIRVKTYKFGTVFYCLGIYLNCRIKAFKITLEIASKVATTVL